MNRRGSLWKPGFEVLDEASNVVFEIKGPCCVCDDFCCTNTFEVHINILNGSYLTKHLTISYSKGLSKK